MGQTLTLDTGYNGELRRWFTGYKSMTYNPRPTVPASCYVSLSWPGSWAVSSLSVSSMPPLRSLLAWLTDQTQLTFLLPDGADYTDTPIPNFTSAGTGYQLLDNAGRARYRTSI